MLTQGGDGPVVERAEAFNRAMNELEEQYDLNELMGPPPNRCSCGLLIDGRHDECGICYQGVYP